MPSIVRRAVLGRRSSVGAAMTPPTIAEHARPTRSAGGTCDSTSTILVGSGSSPPKSVNILANVGMMKISMNAVAPSATGEHHRRVDHGALDLALEGVGLLDVGRETHQDLVQHAARLAGRDHVAEQVVEHGACACRARRTASSRTRPRASPRAITRPNDGLLDCLARMSRHCTSGRPAEIMVANWRVKIARSLVLTDDRRRAWAA